MDLAWWRTVLAFRLALWWVLFTERLYNVFVRPAQQVWCGCRGHAFQLALSYGRIGLRCHECGHTTPGVEWQVRRVRCRVLRFGA